MPHYVKFGVEIHGGLVGDMHDFRSVLEKTLKDLLDPQYTSDVEVEIAEHTGKCKDYGCDEKKPRCGNG